MRNGLLSLVAVLLPVLPVSPLAGQGERDVRLEIQSPAGQTTFQVGEVIPLELVFTSAVPTVYSLSLPIWDRSGRVDVDHFEVEPKTGWSDPLAAHFHAMPAILAGGPLSFRELSFSPEKVDITLNEWVRFEASGKYTVKVRSGRVFAKEASPAEVFEIESKPLPLRIMQASEEWQEKTLQNATEVLDSTEPSGTSYPDEHRGQAINALRYLGTAKAAEALVDYLDVMDLSHAAYLGLISSRTAQPALLKMKRLLIDRDWPVTSEFVSVMAELSLPQGASGEIWRQRQDLEEELYQELNRVVEQKKGEAKAVSERTLLNRNKAMESLKSVTAH